MAKFKIGDKVRIKPTLEIDKKYSDITFLDGNMSKCRGMICTIEEIKSLNEAYRVKENPFWWGEEMLEPVDSKFLCMADGTIIGEFNAGGVLPTDKLIKKEFDVTWIDKIALPTATETKEMVERVSREILKFTNAFPKEDKNLKVFTFYTEEGYRIDKSNNSKVETITTFVKVNGFDNTYLGMATCDKVDYSEREGVLNAIANAVLGGNFDREYEKFLADKKRKYDESCKCKICGRNYYEDEKTGKRTPFTPEDARKHEEWHEQNKKNKREKYLIRKEAKRRLAEAEREGKIEQTMKELYKK